MPKKVDYRTNEQKQRMRYLQIFIIIVVALFVLILLIRALNSIEKEPNYDEEIDTVGFANVKDYSSLAQLLAKYGCTYLSETRTTSYLTVYLQFNIDLYTGNESNENFFNRIIMLVAEYEDYINFELIDEERDIDIIVTCEDSAVVQIEINGDVNYYLNEDTRRNLANMEETPITDFEIQSKELNLLIENNWNPTGLNLGTKDSSCYNYEIYFDEGFEYKVVGREIYNMIFTQKYDGGIVNGLNANSSPETVKAKLGDPTFQNYESIYGYLGEDNYVFFDFQNNEVSIYPVQIIKESEIEEFTNLIDKMNEDSDVKQFSMDLTSLWTDYDIYDYDSDYVDLQYTLKGIKLTISYTSLKNGIYIYANYDGDFNISDMENVYVQSSDLVFEEENKRVSEKWLMLNEQGDYTEEELDEMGRKFSVRFMGDLKSNEIGYKWATFYSRDKEYPDTELDSTLVISSYNWYDDYNFVYSVDDDGIYVFNPVSNSNTKIIDVVGTIEINSAGNGKITYNDTEEIRVNIN